MVFIITKNIIFNLFKNNNDGTKKKTINIYIYIY